MMDSPQEVMDRIMKSDPADKLRFAAQLLDHCAKETGRKKEALFKIAHNTVCSAVTELTHILMEYDMQQPELKNGPQ